LLQIILRVLIGNLFQHRISLLSKAVPIEEYICLIPSDR